MLRAPSITAQVVAHLAREGRAFAKTDVISVLQTFEADRRRLQEFAELGFQLRRARSGKVETRVGRRLIYGLIDPRSDTLFYVGKTHKRREIRLKEHIERALEGRETPISVRIREILCAGQKPTIFVLRLISSDVDWRQAEREQIGCWRAAGHDFDPIIYEPQTAKSFPIRIGAVDILNVRSGG